MIIEKVIATHLKEHFEMYNLLEKCLSAYKKFKKLRPPFSKSKTICYGIDDKHTVFLVLLDFTVAFHTIDHNILLLHLALTAVWLLGFAKTVLTLIKVWDFSKGHIM